MSKINFTTLDPLLNDSQNDVLKKMLARLQLNANTAVDTPSSNVAITNLPLPVVFPSTQNVNVANVPSVNANITNAILTVQATNELEVIQHEHEKLHDGASFHLSEIQAISTGDTRYWMISTPAAPTEVHLTMSSEGTVGYTFAFYETPISPVGGAAWTPVARNRHNSVANAVTALSGLTVGGTGSLLFAHRSGSTGVQGATQARAEAEWVLAHSTNYLFAITAHAANGFFTIDLDWYLS